MNDSGPAYRALVDTFTRIYRLEHLRAVAFWDQASHMPPGGVEARAAALAELARVLHRIRTDAALATGLERAAGESLDPHQRANLREMRREWQLANALPETLVERQALATARCEHAWRRQRPANDWQGFLGNFREVLALAREQAERLSQATGLAPYDALMDQYEPGMTNAELERLFGGLREWLPGLIRQVRERQDREPVIELEGVFPVDRQRVLCEQVMRGLGFDFERGRLDVSAHPFCGGVPEDVRVTTRFDAADFLKSLMGTIHETGHARYEQNLPRDWLGQPVAQARSMAIHESQSLSFEMQLGRHPAFVAWLAPQIGRAFGENPAFESANLYRLITRVTPGLIRVDADEVTYPAHIVLRWEIERALIEGELAADDIPAAWDARMAEWLDLDTRGNFADGPLQDVHWPEGLFGYFPCYSLGAMYAAQWFDRIRQSVPDLDDRIATGDFKPIFGWLESAIWGVGSRWPTDELVVHASGRALDPAIFRRHLESRYLA